MASSAILFVGLLLTWGSAALDAHKAPRHLVHNYLPHIHDRETRVACYDYFQPSLVFYCRREVTRLSDENEVLEFLQSPWPVYLFVPQEAWIRLERNVGAAHRQLGSHWDLYRQCAVVVVTNK